jgi:hypothetical protein
LSPGLQKTLSTNSSASDLGVTLPVSQSVSRELEMHATDCCLFLIQTFTEEVRR